MSKEMYDFVDNTIKHHRIALERAAQLLGDTDNEVITKGALHPFIHHARTVDPGATDNRIAAMAAVYAADSKGWHEMARGIRESITIGIL